MDHVVVGTISQEPGVQGPEMSPRVGRQSVEFVLDVASGEPGIGEHLGVFRVQGDGHGARSEVRVVGTRVRDHGGESSEQTLR